MSFPSIILLLLLFSSCAFFKSSPSLINKDPQELLSAVRVTGEGRGRLSLDQSQYVFGVESVLKDSNDWILVVAIPLQGEEVMMFSDLRKKSDQGSELESFEARIRHEFRARKLHKKISAENFLAELRELIRFILAYELDLERSCKTHKKLSSCSFEGETFDLDVSEKALTISKKSNEGHRIEVVARNLTGPFFSNTDFHLYTFSEGSSSKKPSFSLELFW